MLTIASLQEFGANTAEGMERCMGREDFYLRMCKLALADTNLEKLRTALDAGNLDAAFEAAHALKGVMANLALTPILTPVSEMTELLRVRTDTDYSALLNEATTQFAALQALAAN